MGYITQSRVEKVVKENPPPRLLYGVGAHQFFSGEASFIAPFFVVE